VNIVERVRAFEVEPSIYAADFANLGAQLRELLDAGARIFHYDVGDGHFVPPIVLGPIVLEAIAPMVRERGGFLDCHLMVDGPEKHFEQIARAGGDSVTFHVEASDDPAAAIALARGLGLGVGIAAKIETPVNEVLTAAEGVDFVLCMSIRPGYSGQQFMPEALDRIGALRARLPPDVRIQVDGGISAENVETVRSAGADLLVAGTSIFGADDVGGAYRRLLAGRRSDRREGEEPGHDEGEQGGDADDLRPARVEDQHQPVADDEERERDPDQPPRVRVDG
jgi:ribulose-phosphate 3-epimerase